MELVLCSHKMGTSLGLDWILVEKVMQEGVKGGCNRRLVDKHRNAIKD